jgi:hypothetical protein
MNKEGSKRECDYFIDKNGNYVINLRFNNIFTSYIMSIEK